MCIDFGNLLVLFLNARFLQLPCCTSVDFALQIPKVGRNELRADNADYAFCAVYDFQHFQPISYIPLYVSSLS
jgi:hypothetical protein